MATGTVKWFNDEKGYGFITPDDGDRDLFVHHTGINGSGFKTLRETTKVSYEEEDSDKGPKAVNVEKIENQGAVWRRKTRSRWRGRSPKPSPTRCSA
jgi:cold shock protein